MARLVVVISPAGARTQATILEAVAADQAVTMEGVVEPQMK